MELLGIDIGGSGIKAGIVDSKLGTLVSERYRVSTPNPSNPDTIVEIIYNILQHFEWKKPVGISFPTVILKGKALTTGNLDSNWKDLQIDEFFKKRCGQKFFVINDADAAGIAEMKFGAGVGIQGKVIVITIGTGIGSGFFHDGKLIPNFELGRILGKNGKPVEFYASDATRKKKNLSYEKWGKRIDFYLNYLIRIFSPDLLIIGGGISNKIDHIKPFITIKTPFVTAVNQNTAGIIGSVIHAAEKLETSKNYV